MKNFILVIILIGLISLIPLSMHLLNKSGAFNDNHIKKVVFTKPYGKPIIGATYTFNGKKYVCKKGAVIIAPAKYGGFIVLKF